MSFVSSSPDWFTEWTAKNELDKDTTVVKLKDKRLTTPHKLRVLGKKTESELTEFLQLDDKAEVMLLKDALSGLQKDSEESSKSSGPPTPENHEYVNVPRTELQPPDPGMAQITLQIGW